MRVIELGVADGHAMIAGVPLTTDVPDGRLWGLPPDLVTALQEWARVASSREDGTGYDGGTVSRRGRHLAARLSGVLGAPVDYCDPVTGYRVALRGVTRTPHPPPVALPAREPTPWGTGLTMAALTAVVVLLANLALALPMIVRLGLLGLAVDVVVAAGLVPALWLNRRAPTWRWAVYGTFGGMALAVPVLAVQALGA